MKRETIGDLENEMLSLREQGQDLLKRADHIESFLRPYLGKSVTSSPKPSHHQDEDVEDYSQPTLRRRRRTGTRADACFALIKENGKPMSRNALFQRLNENGSGPPTLESISSALSRDSRFTHLGNGIWAIEGQFDPTAQKIFKQEDAP